MPMPGVGQTVHIDSDTVPKVCVAAVVSRVYPVGRHVNLLILTPWGPTKDAILRWDMVPETEYREIDPTYHCDECRNECDDSETIPSTITSILSAK